MSYIHIQYTHCTSLSLSIFHFIRVKIVSLLVYAALNCDCNNSFWISLTKHLHLLDKIVQIQMCGADLTFIWHLQYSCHVQMNRITIFRSARLCLSSTSIHTPEICTWCTCSRQNDYLIWCNWNCNRFDFDTNSIKL